uniref:Uncharacterized protein n=1 Tax=Geospiza parvula TaxID=87175 RepID=A0A8C3MR66_GEOPR
MGAAYLREFLPEVPAVQFLFRPHFRRKGRGGDVSAAGAPGGGSGARGPDEPRCRRAAGSGLGSGNRRRPRPRGPPELRPCRPSRSPPRPLTSCRVATGPRSSCSPANRCRDGRRIGKDLSNTFAKLEKLTLLAKRKSLFDDKAVEIEELTYIIKQDIGGLNAQIARLQELLRARGGPDGRHLQSHSNGVLLALQVGLGAWGPPEPPLSPLNPPVPPHNPHITSCAPLCPLSPRSNGVLLALQVGLGGLGGNWGPPVPPCAPLSFLSPP